MATPSKGLSGEISLITFSLLLGLIFWAIVKQQETLSQTILVPVTVTNAPEFVELEGFEPSNLAVKFSLRAGDETLARDPGRFRINVDLGVLRNRVAISENFVEYPIDITREMLEFPERLTFSSFDDSPARVVFRARPRVVRVPVTVNLANTEAPADGYRVEVENVLVEPSEVLLAVDEPRHLLAQQGQLRVTTEVVDVRGRRDQVSGLYALALGAEKGIFPLPGQAAPSVEVIVPIPEIQSRQVFEDIPIRYDAMAAGVRAILEPPTATVTVEGPQSIVNRLERDDFLLLPRPVAFLDDEQVGGVVDTSIEVRFEGLAAEDVEKLRQPVLTPSLVKISFVADEEDLPESEPEMEGQEAQVGVDPALPNTPLEPLPGELPLATETPEGEIEDSEVENGQTPREDGDSEDSETEIREDLQQTSDTQEAEAVLEPSE